MVGMNKMSRKLVVDLIKTWQSNGRISWLDYESLEELKNIRFVNTSWEVKMLIASNSARANSLLWDNKFQSASIWLMKNGFDNNDNNRKYASEARNLAHKANNERNVLRKIAINSYEPFKRSNQWDKCK